MKILATVLILCGMMAAQEIRRPTMDVDPGAALSIGCLPYTTTASSAMPLSYDAAGLATSSTNVTSGASGSRTSSRLFREWQTTGNTYTGLVLNIVSASSGYLSEESTTLGAACISYSINGGITWTNLHCDTDGTGWARTTDTITLTTSQSLSLISVAVCSSGHSGNSKIGTPAGFDNVTVWDIWTVGSTSTPASGSGSSSGQAQRGAVIVF